MVVKSASANFTNGRIQVAVAKLQHNSKPVRSYVSEKEVREVLLALGVASETADDYLLRLFPQNQELTANSYSVWQTHFKQAVLEDYAYILRFRWWSEIIFKLLYILGSALVINGERIRWEGSPKKR